MAPAELARQRAALEEAADLLERRRTSWSAAASTSGVLGEHRHHRRRRPRAPSRPCSARRPRAPSSPSARSVACWLRSGARSSTALRARCSALLTAASVVSSASRGLGGGEAEDLAQDQHRALGGGQVLERGDERQLDALALLVAELGVGVGLEPHRLLERRAGPVAGIGRGPKSTGSIALRARWSCVRHALVAIGTATSAASCGPRSARAPATRAAASPAGRPRRRGPSRASGSSARAARRGRARPGRRRRRRRTSTMVNIGDDECRVREP